MNKFLIMPIAFLVLLTGIGCDKKQEPPFLPAAGSQSSIPPVLTLGPASSEYSIDEVAKEAVQFAVSVENKGDSEVTFAHPTICFPENYKIGDSLDFLQRHGVSEILLTVEKPDGSIAVLRDGPHFFDPDNVSDFIINPGESDLFYIGWFFQNARGGWEGDVQAKDIFTEKGKYALSLLYRNFFPKALVPDTVTGKSHFIKVWTGELTSNKVTVTIK